MVHQMTLIHATLVVKPSSTTSTELWVLDQQSNPTGEKCMGEDTNSVCTVLAPYEAWFYKERLAII